VLILDSELQLVASSERLGTWNAEHGSYEVPLPPDLSGASNWTMNAIGDHGYHLGLCLPAGVSETGTLRWRITKLNDKRDDMIVNWEARFRRKHKKTTALDLLSYGGESQSS
jgi:hypothetical protein